MPKLAAHNLLADTYLHEKNYDKARDEAQVAIAKGKASGKTCQSRGTRSRPGAGELGQRARRRTGSQRFLEQSPQHPLAGQVRT